MKIIDAVVVAAEPLILSLQLENSLANRIPGAWQTQGNPTWETPSPDVTLSPQLNGLECVVSPNSPSFVGVVTITYSAKVDRDMNGQYQDMTGSTQIEFRSATQASQLGTTTNSGVSFKKIVN